MDRLVKIPGRLAALGLTVVMGVMGCRGGLPEVPPERPYVAPPAASMAPQVGFSSEPAANAFAGASVASPPFMSMNPATTGSYSGQPTHSINDSGAAPASFEPSKPQAPR